MKTHDDWRASGIVGATVYDDQGNSIGTVSDLLVSSDGSVQNMVISVGGFLGIGSKLVEVPFKNIKFAPSASNPASGSKEATPANASSTAMSATAPAHSASTAGTTGVAAAGNGVGAAPASDLAAPTNTGPGGTPGATVQGAVTMTASHEYSLVLPDATKASLTSDAAFSY
jgi:sporulation protein YlmC with PRC-barrel domain